MSLPYEKKRIPLAKQLRKDQTPWERKLWYDFLRTCPCRFQRQKTIGPYIVDFYCHKAKLVVELDEGHHMEPERQDYDRHRTAYLEGLGLRVLRFSDLDVFRNFPGVCQVIIGSLPEGAVSEAD